MTDHDHSGTEPEPVETVRDGYGEAQPTSDGDVEEARHQDEVLRSSPATTKDRSLTGETRPVDLDQVEGPAIDEG